MALDGAAAGDRAGAVVGGRVGMAEAFTGTQDTAIGADTLIAAGLPGQGSAAVSTVAWVAVVFMAAVDAGN